MSFPSSSFLGDVSPSASSDLLRSIELLSLGPCRPALSGLYSGPPSLPLLWASLSRVLSLLLGPAALILHPLLLSLHVIPVLLASGSQFSLLSAASLVCHDPNTDGTLSSCGPDVAVWTTWPSALCISFPRACVVGRACWLPCSCLCPSLVSLFSLLPGCDLCKRGTRPSWRPVWPVLLSSGPRFSSLILASIFLIILIVLIILVWMVIGGACWAPCPHLLAALFSS